MVLEQIHENLTRSQVFVFVLAHESSSFINYLLTFIKECPAHLHELLTVENLITVVDFTWIVA
jgi:hypothetical protein